MATSDYNAKHMHWRSRLILSKRRILFKAIATMNMATFSIGEPTNTPFVNIKTLDLLNFGIIRGISKDYCCIESYPELSSNHSSVIFTVNSKIMTDSKIKTNLAFFATVKQKGHISRSYWRTSLDNSIPLKIDNDITCAISFYKILSKNYKLYT